MYLLYSIPAYAEGNISADLNSIASSLGADTDYLNIPFFEKIVVNPDGKIEYRKYSYGIAAMEVLVHNGQLKLSELQADVTQMNEIKDSPELQENIKTQCYKLVDRIYYDYLFKGTPAKDKIPALLQTAQEAQKNGEYFLITYSDLDYEYDPDITTEDKSVDLYAHSVTGIGITDGSWTFNDKQFDKCILTLDPVNLSENNGAFSEDTCIYVNSETNDYYIPKYSDSAEEDIHIIAVDNDTLINGDTSDIYRIKLIHKNSTALYTITTEKDGVETIRNRENDYLDYRHNAYNGNFVIKADNIKIDCDSYSYSGDGIMLMNGDKYVDAIISPGTSTFSYDGKTYRLSGTYKPELTAPVGSEVNDCFSFGNEENYETELSLYGKILEGLCFEPAENGFFVEAVNTLRMVYESKHYGNIFVTEKTKVEYDENGITGFFIDRDKDGIFEHKIEKGDVNCDGKIDSSDASCILADYAALSTGENASLNKMLADYNNDNAIDSSDASEVLAKYAELSTSK